MPDRRRHDTLAQAKSETALAESERRFQAAFESAGTGMCLTAPDGTFLNVNRALCGMLGYSQEELTARDFASLTHPEDLAISRECVRCLLAGESETCRFEKRYIGGDGRTVWADVSTSLFRDSDGQPLYFITQVQDITDRKKAEAELRRTQQLLSSLVEHAPTPIYATELDTRYRFANPAWERLSQTREKDAVGKTVAELFGPATAEKFEADNRPVVETGSTVTVEESGDLAGQTYHFHTVRFPVLDGNGAVEAIGAITADVTDLRRAEAALRESEERFRTAFEHAAIGMTLTGVDGRLIETNHAFARMVGRPTDELASVGFVELTHPDDVQASVEATRRLLAGESEAEFLEKRYLRPDGQAVWAEVEVFLVRDASRAPVHFVTHQRDITGRRRRQAALRESEERFRTAFENAPVGVCLTAVDGSLLRVNRAFCQMLGHSEDHLVGTDVAALSHPDDLEASRSAMGSLLAAGRGTYQAEQRYRHRDGRDVWISVSSSLVSDADGRPLHFVTHAVDITDRKRAEQALQESERHLRETTDLLPDMVFELDSDGRVTYVNRAVGEILGYTSSDLETGLAVEDAMDAETLSRALAALAASVTPGLRLVGTYDIRAKDGSAIPAEIHTMRVLRPDGELLGYRGVMRDISDRRRAEGAERLAAVGQLAAGVAHEFNNLLAALMLEAEAASQEKTPDEYEQLVELVLQSARHGRDICRSLTLFARPKEPRREPVRVEAVLDVAVSLAARPIENLGIAVTRDYRTAGNCVHADAGQLQQVFLNLIINACHAMPAGGELALRSEHRRPSAGSGEVVVTVTDTGTGIRPEHLHRVFEPFFTTKGWLGQSGTPGTGLGLSVSHGIVQAHGGRMDVRSRVGAGTSLEVVLPAYGGPAPAEETGDTSPEQSPQPTQTVGAARVLVAEDGEALSHLVRAVLEINGHEVVCVATTAEAISAMRATRFDLVITDLLMPGGGGREVLQSARSGEEPPPVLVITGVVDAQVEEEILALGAGAFVRKPFTRAELTRAVDALLAGGGRAARAR